MLTGLLQTKDYERFTIVSETTREPLHEFAGAAAAGRAYPGDLVIWDSALARVTAFTRRPVPQFLVGTLELASKTRYGMTSRGAPLFRFTPFSEAWPPFFVGCAERDTTRNILVRIEVGAWDPGATCPRGVLVEKYGPVGDLAIEEEALTAHYGPVRWRRQDLPVELHAPPAPAARVVGAETFHIDPPGCKDIDDAVTILQGETPGDWLIKIHIADVASWLVANPGLWHKASAASQTLYRDGVAVRPMFYEGLSEDLFSLVPGKPRAVWSLTVPWSPRLGLGAPMWSHEMIRVTGSYTYKAARGAMWAELLGAVTAAMAGRGGEVLEDPHDWIEQLMLFYNTEAAKLLQRAACGVLRRHAAPEQARLDKLRALGLPAERMAMKAGEYCLSRDDNVQHWGLQRGVYCHASSPIRRWADCINQMALREVLLYGGVQDQERLRGTTGEVAALNEGARRARAYERDLQYVRELLKGPRMELAGVVVESGRVWIEAWSRLVRADTRDLAAGTRVLARVFCDATKRNWKRRLVVELREAAMAAAAAPAPA